MCGLSSNTQDFPKSYCKTWTSLTAPVYWLALWTWQWGCWSRQVNALNRGANNVKVLLFTTPHKLLPTRIWPATLLPWDLSHIWDRALRALEEMPSLRDQFKNFPTINCWGKDNKKRKAKEWIRAPCHPEALRRWSYFHVPGLPLPGRGSHLSSSFLHEYYQMRHFLSGFIGDPLGHWKLLEKSWLLLTGPETRSGNGLCGSVFREDWSFSGSWCPHIAWREAK